MDTEKFTAKDWKNQGITLAIFLIASLVTAVATVHFTRQDADGQTLSKVDQNLRDFKDQVKLQHGETLDQISQTRQDIAAFRTQEQQDVTAIRTQEQQDIAAMRTQEQDHFNLLLKAIMDSHKK